MDSDSVSDQQRSTDRTLLKEECEHLLTEIERLLMTRSMQDDRVQNVTQLVITNFCMGCKYDWCPMIQVYAMVNIEDSRAMKRLSYITMIFLPGSFMAVRQPIIDEKTFFYGCVAGCFRYECHGTQCRNLWYYRTLRRNIPTPYPIYDLDNPGLPESVRFTRRWGHVEKTIVAHCTSTKNVFTAA